MDSLIDYVGDSIAATRTSFFHKLMVTVAGMGSSEWEPRRIKGRAQLCFAAVFNDITVAHDHPVEIPSEDCR